MTIAEGYMNISVMNGSAICRTHKASGMVFSLEFFFNIYKFF